MFSLCASLGRCQRKLDRYLSVTQRLAVMAGEKTDSIRWHQRNVSRDLLRATMRPVYGFVSLPREQGEE